MSLCKKCLSAPSNSKPKEQIEGLEDGEICDRCGYDPVVERDRQARVAKLVIGKHFFQPGDLFKEGHKITKGLPEDAEFVKFERYPIRDAYVFLFRSKEFEPIDELAQLDDIPEIEIEITELREDD